MVYNGMSCYITGTSYLSQIREYMILKGMNTIRISSREAFLEAGSNRAFNKAYVDWFLTNTDFMIIIEPNHIYPPDESGATIFRNHLSEVDAHLIYIANLYKDNPRIIIEPLNEYVSNDLWTLGQHFIDLLRPVTNCGILINKWNQAWKKLDDTLNKDYYSYHFYFNSWNVSGAISKINEAIQAGIPANRILNTEIGADFNEEAQFDKSEVLEVNDFLTQCTIMGVGNTIWMYQNIQNADTYETLGLIIPDSGEENEMVNKTFSGKLTATDSGAKVSNVTVKITVTGGVTDTLTAITDVNGNYSVSKDYQPIGTVECTAVASVEADATSASAQSPASIFTIIGNLLKRALSLTVS